MITLHRSAPYLTAAILLLAVKTTLCVPADTSQGVSSPDTSIMSVSDSTSRAIDTTAKAAPAQPLTPAAVKRSADTVSVATAQDTSYRFWQHPYWLIGASWTLGSAPLFAAWEQGMPDSLGVFGLNAEMFPHDTANGKKDYRRLMLEVKEKPNTYNVSFPVRLAWVPVTCSTYSATICLEGDLLVKTFQATIRHDTIGGRVNITKRLMQAAADIGFLYDVRIPSRYFSIADIERASLLLGVYIEPLLYVRQTGRATGVDIADSLYRSILERVTAQVTQAGSSYGFGLSWRIGITTLRHYSEASGLAAGLSYRGGWQYFPRLSGREINPQGDNADGAFSSISHRLSLDVQLAAGRKKTKHEAASRSGTH